MEARALRTLCCPAAGTNISIFSPPGPAQVKKVPLSASLRPVARQSQPGPRPKVTTLWPQVSYTYIYYRAPSGGR